MITNAAHFERTSRRGFTLIEVTVAVVIMAIMAAMLIPRFSRTERRRFDAIVDQVNDMLIVYAQRDRMNRQPVGIFHDYGKNWLTVVLLDEIGAPGTDQYGWRVDPIVQPIKLPDEIIEVSAYEDYQMIDITQWPLTSRSDQARPTIQIDIASDMFSAELTLAPHAMSPRIKYSYRNKRAGVSDSRKTIDLDQGGRNREDW